MGGQLRFMQDNGMDVFTACHGDFDRDGHFNMRHLTRSIRPVKDLKAIAEMVKIIRKVKPDIVHSHTPKAGLVAMIAAKWCKVPHRLHTVAGLPLMEKTGLFKRILIWVERVIYKNATLVLPNSNGLKSYIEKDVFQGKKLQIIGHGSSNGINTKHFDPTAFSEGDRAALRKEWGLAEETTLFFFIGRLVADKGIHELMEAFNELQKEGLDIALLLVGPLEPELDPLRDDVLKEIEENKKVITTGFVSDVRPFLAAGDILTFPSYREGFPNVPMQAAAFCKPMILSNINGCNELVAHNKTGLLVEAKSSLELKTAMKAYLTDKNLAMQHAKAAQSYVRENFDQNHVWQSILACYKNLNE